MLARRKWITFPSAEIPEAVTKNDPKTDIYTTYRIVVKDGGESWTIYRRYSNFIELHSALKEHFSEDILPKLPEHRWSLFDFTSFWKDDFIQKRRLSLEAYLQTLLADAQFFQTSEVRSFLEPDPLSKKTKGKESDTFLLPPPAASVGKIPPVILMPKKKDRPEKEAKPWNKGEANQLPSGSPIEHSMLLAIQNEGKLSGLQKEDASDQIDFCYVNALLNSTKDHLEFLAQVKKDLSIVNNAFTKLQIIEEKRNRLDSTLSTLRQHLTVLDQLKKHPHITPNTSLVRYFDICIKQINTGLAWYTSTENDALEKLYSESSEQQGSDLTKSVIRFEEEAELLAISAAADSKEATMAKVKQLQRSINETLKKIDPHNEDQALINRFMNVLKYVQDNFYEQEDVEDQMDKLD